MSLPFWNVCGYQKKNLFAEIKSFCYANHVEIMMICEIKSLIPPCSVIRRCDFSELDFILTIGRFGGLWVMWKNSWSNPFCLNVIHKSSWFVVCNIKLSVLNVSFVAIFLYAPALLVENIYFAMKLVIYTKALQTPYILIGDFN